MLLLISASLVKAKHVLMLPVMSHGSVRDKSSYVACNVVSVML
jgi:hypothetical protein